MAPNLVNHLWQSTAFAAAVWGLTVVLRRNQAQIRYRLWMLASLKFLLPFSILIAAGEHLRSVTARPIAHSNLSVTMAQIVEPLPQTPETAFSDPAAASSLPVHHFQHWLLLLAGLWACGSLLVVCRWLLKWQSLRKTVRAATAIAVLNDIPVLSSDSQLEPGVYGMVKPVLLLPADIDRRVTAQQLEAILAHEMCHIQRRDNLTATMHMLVEAAFWFHPAVWWIGARLVEERERACDEAVIEARHDAEIYAEGILNVCKIYLESPLPCVSGVSGAGLKDRIVRIMTEQVGLRLNLSRKLLLAVAAVMAATLPVILGLIHATQLRAQSASKTLAFDVASVRPSKETKRSSNITLGAGDISTPSNGILSAKNFTLMDYLYFAYKLTDYQMQAIEETSPNWLTTDRYSIEARTEKRDVTKDELRFMMRSLLAERFKLAIHYEKRQVPVFDVVMIQPGTFGPKLRRHPAGVNCVGASQKVTTADGKEVDIPMQSEKLGFLAVCGAVVGVPASEQDRWSFGGSDVPMSFIAGRFASWGNLGRPVVDKTGLAGKYDFVLDYTPEPRPSYATVDSGGPSFQQALKEQLGLKLEPERAPVEFMVLDHVERPIAN